MKTTLAIACILVGMAISVNAKTIYVSPTGNDSNYGSSEGSAVETLLRAKEICENSSDNSFTILLKGGVTHTNFPPVEKVADGDDIKYWGFVWDIDKELTISNYGSTEYARLYSGKNLSEGGPTEAILIIEPSSKQVIIEHIFLDMWMETAIMTYKTQNVSIRNIKINNVGTAFIDDPIMYTEPDLEKVPYSAGVMYPKNSTNILMEGIVMTNCSNALNRISQLHGFYCTRLRNSTIKNCYLYNITGSPFKIRRQPGEGIANNILITNNECYYTGHTPDLPNNVQYGFIRYSGENKGWDNCPKEIYIENNVFHYPTCVDGQDCYNMADQEMLSNSAYSVCGNPISNGNVILNDNSWKFKWEPENQNPNDVSNVMFEAENGITQTPMLVKQGSSAFGGRYVEVASGNNSLAGIPDSGKVKFTANLQSGNYKIWGRTTAPNGGDDSFWVQVDNGTVYNWNHIETSTDWNWSQVHDANNGDAVINWNLSEGEHTITFYYREDGAKLDRVYITKDGDDPSFKTADLSSETPNTAPAKINVYPNPSKGKIKVDVYYLNNATLSVYNVSGALIKRLRNIDKSTSVDLDKGVYILTVGNNTTLNTQKVIVH